MLAKMGIVAAIIVAMFLAIPFVEAASDKQGKPFEEIWNAIQDLGQTLGSISCADGQVLKWDDVSNQWICADDDDDSTLNVITVDGDMKIAIIPGLYVSKATCPAGTILTGGGYKFSGFSNTVKGVTYQNGPVSDQEWEVRFSYDSSGSGSYFFKAVARCATVSP